MSSNHWDSRSLAAASAAFIHLAGIHPHLPGISDYTGIDASLYTQWAIGVNWVSQLLELNLASEFL